MLKKCSRCKKDKELSAFQPRSGRAGHQPHCIECQALYKRDHYERNKAEYVQKARERRQSLQAFVDGLKRGRPCMDCGQSFKPHQMDFDHRGAKTADISVMVHNCRSQTAILQELEQCDLVCACCHRDRTYNRLPRSSTG